MRTNKFRNKFEENVSLILKDYCEYEPSRYDYIVKKKYIPDFVGQSEDKLLLIECKGFFRVGDTKKYTSIRDSLSDDKELIFILYNPNKKLRKGSKMNMGEWCDKEGIRWFTLNNIKNVFE